jgi:thiopurine S-methyltransferase
MTNAAEESSERLQFWHDRWANGKTGWHKDEVNEFLERNIDKILPKVEGHATTCSNTKRVLVPLCGKTTDMAYLANNPGVSEVVGVDGIQAALTEFMEEHKDLELQPVKDGTVQNFEKLTGKKISLLRGDFFELDSSKTGTYDVIFDRASMVAIKPSLRESYVQVIKNVIAPGGKILLITLERQGTDEEAVNKGPPFTIPEKTVRDLYGGEDCVKSITLLSAEDTFEKDPGQKERYAGVDKLMELVFLIEAK